MEILCNFTVQYSKQHLKCGQCDWRIEFLILLNFNLAGAAVVGAVLDTGALYFLVNNIHW